jgi:hypothetical protein
LPENVYLDGKGDLVIRTDKQTACTEADGCFNYTSGGVISRGKVRKTPSNHRRITSDLLAFPINWKGLIVARAWPSNEKGAVLAQKLGQLQPLIALFPHECMGQLASFGAA